MTRVPAGREMEMPVLREMEMNGDGDGGEGK